MASDFLSIINPTDPSRREQGNSQGRVLPILPVRSTVLFPHAVLPLTVGRESSIQLIQSLGDVKTIVVVAQRDERMDSPQPSDLYSVGTMATVHKVVKMPNQSLFVFTEGTERVKLGEFAQLEPFMMAAVDHLPEVDAGKSAELEALQRNVIDQFQQIVTTSPTLSDELQTIALNIEDPGRLVDFIASSLPFLATTDKQELLEPPDVMLRMERINKHLAKEAEVQQLRNKIQTEVQDQVQQSQRDYYLREQLKAIQKELGEVDEGQRDIDELRQKIEDAGMPDDVKKEALKELSRLSRMSPMASDSSLVRNYVEWLASLPWAGSTGPKGDINKGHGLLAGDHSGREKVKERILDYLSVLELKPDMKGPILCFLGPPGVGKTSLGKSIARAMGRKFVRVSLGGMHDEAEIRGHRRTYIGALPGQIMQHIRRAETMDPVVMLDEVDKLGRDFRGDPAAALMEVLDPEENANFRDHYLDVPFDLSKVIFIATANWMDPIPEPLRDRMEILELPGYTEEEKIHIAKRFLIPRQTKEHGITLGEQIEFTDESLHDLIHHYTREAGVRNLEREIATLVRKPPRRTAEGKMDKLIVTPDVIREALGIPKFRLEKEVEERTKAAGVSVGLVWTPVGGDIVFIEASKMRGGKQFTMTGHLGEVMQESMRAALSWVRANSDHYGIDADFYRKLALHVHVPSGAIPKDGPSAGIAMVTALVSLLTGRPVRPRVAMTGEISLSGFVLPIGGVKEKVLGAKRAGIREVILPQENEPNVKEDLQPEMLEDVKIHFVRTVDEALEIALGKFETPVRPATGGPIGA